MGTRLRHLWLALTVLPGLAFDRRRRTLFREMQAFSRDLPRQFKAPLPRAMQRLTPDQDAALAFGEQTVRQLADVAALIDRRTPLGLCLRRSLIRYWFLRRAGIAVVVQFGARFVGGKPDREVTGHAWLTLGGAPYHEADENWQGFTVLLAYPAADEARAAADAPDLSMESGAALQAK